MNKHLKWFAIVTLFGVALNAVFFVPAIFFPDAIFDMTDTEPLAYTVWLRNAGVLLLLVSIWHAAGAYDPIRFPFFAWMVPIARLSAAVFFVEVVVFNSHNSIPDTSVIVPFIAVDAVVGLAKAILLQLGMPDDLKLNGANLKRFFRAAVRFPTLSKSG